MITMENKEEIKGINVTNRELVGTDHEIQELKQEPSPFKIYEERYCSKCEDYRGCIGLIDSMSMSMDTQDNKKPGYEALDSTTKNMINSAMKSMVNMAFSARFKIILDCTNMRNYIG